MSTSSDFDKLVKRIENLEKKLDGNIYPVDKCPNCGSGEITFKMAKDNKTLNLTGIMVMRALTCAKCDATWKVASTLA